MYCPNCGKIYASKLMLKICEYCGENLAERDAEKIEKFKHALGDPMKYEYFITGPEVRDVRFQFDPFAPTINEAREHMGLKPFVNDNIRQVVVNRLPSSQLQHPSTDQNTEGMFERACKRLTFEMQQHYR